jgi:hypothetical protein
MRLSDARIGQQVRVLDEGDDGPFAGDIGVVVSIGVPSTGLTAHDGDIPLSAPLAGVPAIGVDFAGTELGQETIADGRGHARWYYWEDAMLQEENTSSIEPV